MNDPLQYPKLRWPVNINLHTVEGQEVLVINCPSGISPSPLFLTPAIAPVIAAFQGELSTSQILEKFSQYGLQEKLLNDLIQLLDENLYLASPRYYSAERGILDSFLNNPVREAALAGSAYPKDRASLEHLVDGYLSINAGSALQSAPLLGLVSPHIDYRRGGAAYGIAYNHLLAQQHDLYIVIGTAHQYSRHMFHLSAKDFAGPFGMLATDKRFVGDLATRYGSRSFKDEILHRREHSLELQMPFLGRHKLPPSIVPILVGGFHQMLDGSKPPSQYEEYDAFAAALSHCVSERRAEGARICFVCGVDMAHIGRHFGDEESLTPDKMAAIRERDMVYLRTIEGNDLDGLFAHVAEDRDARRICGFSTMYTVLDVTRRANLKYDAITYDYRQAVDYESDCAVTFAAMGLYESAVGRTNQ